MNKCERCGREFPGLSWETVCYRCQKDDALKRQQEVIRSGEVDDIDTYSSDYVICPWCGNALETCVGYEDFREIHEEGSHEMVCDECGKKYILNTCCSWDYETERLEGG